VKHTAIALVFGLSGCGMGPETRPSDSQLAEACGVRPAELTKAKSDLNAAVETDVLNVGSCKLVKGYSGKIKLLVIRYPPKASDQ
jgi:hypothetical protein